MRCRSHGAVTAWPTDTGLANVLLHKFAANQIWLEVASLAADLLAWTQHLALTGTPARTWEPKRLRLRLLNIAGRIVHTGRRKPAATPEWLAVG